MKGHLKILFAYPLQWCPCYRNLSFGFLISFRSLRTCFFWFWRSLFHSLRFETFSAWFYASCLMNFESFDMLAQILLSNRSVERIGLLLTLSSTSSLGACPKKISSSCPTLAGISFRFWLWERIVIANFPAFITRFRRTDLSRFPHYVLPLREFHVDSGFESGLLLLTFQLSLPGSEEPICGLYLR